MFVWSSDAGNLCSRTRSLTWEMGSCQIRCTLLALSSRCASFWRICRIWKYRNRGKERKERPRFKAALSTRVGNIRRTVLNAFTSGPQTNRSGPSWPISHDSKGSRSVSPRGFVRRPLMHEMKDTLVIRTMFRSENHFIWGLAEHACVFEWRGSRYQMCIVFYYLKCWLDLDI